MNSSGHGVSANVICLRTLRLGHSRFQKHVTSNDLTQEGLTNRADDHVKMEAKTKPPGAGRGRRAPPLAPSAEFSPADPLVSDFRLPECEGPFLWF